eukprot:CAMPEP_0115562184 /NCGR_PEP_ID=MMETSP0271-20121206/101371_1 /TAXON_ID=71861 /ORGANISM="Scrippsiella trochoidea, Strain CCMP3099" /LENGTH=58 /DNA_ID=CAMNT_0002996319 /DNA_START=32 /DNA_END=208 /DNA_ORIENTATION=+
MKDDVGFVTGPSTGRDRGRINVDFPNLRSANMLLVQVRRDSGEAAAGAGDESATAAAT